MSEQEPVAWMYEWVNEIGEHVKSVVYNFYDDANLIPLYTAPPVKSEQEPVAWMYKRIPPSTGLLTRGLTNYIHMGKDKPLDNENLIDVTPLYTAPPKPNLIAYVADPSVGFDVSRSPQGMPLVWLGKLEYGDKLYRVGKDDEC